jgi:AbrB family looped-hinge helix DNA binding protein
MIKNNDKGFYGATTLGEKGQVVIPAAARESMGVKKGEKFLVFGMGKDVVTLIKLSNLKKFTSHLEKKLSAMRKMVGKK